MEFRGKQYLYSTEQEAIEHCKEFRNIEYHHHRKMENKVGFVFGGLEVKSLVGFHVKNNQPYWLCGCSLCDLGMYIVTASKSLMSGDVKSCGCEAIRSKAETRVTHNLTNSSEYRAWASMKSRCTDESQTSFYHYGELGISTCDEWLASFEAFIGDMGMKSHPDQFLDRIDPTGNYCKENCRWVTLEVSCHNKGMFKSNTSGFKGVSKGYGTTFRVCVTKSGVNHRASGFKTAQEAALWYDEKAIELYGEEFAMTNLKLGLLYA